MGDFGHMASSGGGFFVDQWGVGPFVIEADGRSFRFEDSNRFGPWLVNKNGDIRDNPWPPEKSPFWRAHRIWRRQGRQVAADGVTCVWHEPNPMIIKRVAGKHFQVIDGGEEDGKTIEAVPAYEQAANIVASQMEDV